MLVVERATRGRNAEENAGDLQRMRLGGVVAVVVFGVASDGFESHAPQHPIAARHRRWLRGHRHEHVHIARVSLAPEPDIHSAHRVADDEAHMPDTETYG